MTGKTFTCACCYGEFTDELTDAEKHEAYLEDFGEELDSDEDIPMVCDDCYCELVGESDRSQTYAQVLH